MGANPFPEWLEGLRPFDPAQDLETVSALAAESTDEEAWGLLAEEGSRLLLLAQLPATALLLNAAISQVSRKVPLAIGRVFEEVLRRAFVPRTGVQVPDERSARRTYRLAAALRQLGDELLGNQEPPERHLCTLAGLELLMRVHQPNSGQSDAVFALRARLSPRFPAVASELSSYWDKHPDEGSTADPKDLWRWQAELHGLGAEIAERLKVRHTRGLMLLSRIQADNNQQVFRPLVETLLSTDRLSEEQAGAIQRLDAAALLDRNPLQVGAPGTRKIVGSARTDTIRDYEALIGKLNQALRLRQKLDGHGRREGESADLHTHLERYLQEMRAPGDETGQWLLARLLRREGLVAVALPWIPDVPVLSRESARSIRLALLYAAAEPRTLARAPEETIALADPVAGLLPLLRAAGSLEVNPPRPEGRQVLDALATAGRHLEARIWAGAAEGSEEERQRLGAQAEQRTSQDRRALIEALGATQARWPEEIGGEVRQRFLELIQRGRSNAGAGFLRLGGDLQEQAQRLLAQTVPLAPAEPTPAPAEPPTAPAAQTTLSDKLLGRPVATATRPPAPPTEPQADLYLMFGEAERARIRQDLGTAERQFRRILASEPSYHRARSQLAVLLNARRRHEEAVHLLEAGLSLQPRHLPFLNQLSMICRAMGWLDKARRHAETGLSYCETPDQEVGFLSELIIIERRSGNTALAVEYWHRLPERQRQMPPFQPEAVAARSSALGDPSWEAVYREPQREPAELPQPELYPEHLEVSEFLGEDLRREYTKVSPTFLDSDGPEKVSEFAARMAREAISNPNTERPAEAAEGLRTAAKLLTEIDERHPGFNYIRHLHQRFREEAPRLVARDHKETLRRYLSFYSYYMGDHHRRYGRVDTARAYYLEHFRVFGTLQPFSLHSGEKLVHTWREDGPGFRERAREATRRLYPNPSAQARSRGPAEEFLVLFQLAIDDLCLCAEPISDWHGFLWAFIDICRVNQVARRELLHCAERPGHPVRRLIERLQAGWPTGVTEPVPAEWVHKVLQARDDMQQQISHDLQYLRERLLGAERYAQAVELIGQVRERMRGIDARLTERAQTVLRHAERYRAVPRFEEKGLLASSIQLDARNLQEVIEAAPTEIGRLHLVKILFRVSRDIETTFERFKQRSRPSLHVQLLKSTRSEAEARCDVQIENQGLSPASDIRLQFHLPESDRELGRLHVESLVPGQAYAAVEKLVLDLSGVAATEASDVMVVGSYRDADGAQQPLAQALLRVAAASDQTFRNIPNPFVTGRIIRDESLFKGRDRVVEDILIEVGNPVTPGAVVIYGQKRSGKSSILYWIAEKAPDWLVPVGIDLHDAFADAEVLPLLLYLMAEKIADEARQNRRLDLPSIDDEALLKAPAPTLIFRRYLQQVNELLGPGRRLLLLFDEFTDLTERIDRGVIERGFLRYLKSLIEHGTFSCVICGIDSMPRVLKSYSNDFAIANTRLVSYLDRQSALELIEDPIRLPDQASRFTPGAAQDIVDLTAGFAYYIQLLGSRLVEYLNRERNPDPLITRADVEQTTREVVQGKVPIYPWTCFDNLCRYKEDPERDGRAAILEGFLLFLIADEMKTAEYASLADLVRRIDGAAREDEIEDALNDLVDREVLVMPSGTPVRQFRIKVLLFYRWVIANRLMDQAATEAFRRRLGLAATALPGPETSA